MRHRLMAACVVLMCAARASAEAPPSPQKQSVSGGVQWAAPYKPGSAPGAQVSWRRWASPRLGTDAAFRWYTRDEISSYGLDLGVLGRTSAGRMSLIAGGGPGLFVDRQPPETYTTFGLHGLFEMDVRLVSGVSVFAGLRIELRDIRHGESSSGYPTAGFRIGF